MRLDCYISCNQLDSTGNALFVDIETSMVHIFQISFLKKEKAWLL